MTAQSIDSPRPKRKRIGKTKIKQIKAMKIAGMTERDIVAVSNIPKTTVHQIIHKTFTEEELKSFQDQEPRILADKRAMILQSIDQDDIKGASFKDKGVVYGIFVEKQQLIEGKATTIYAYDPSIMRTRMQELRQLLSDSQANIIDVIENNE
jgi:hypothetical protein